MDASNSLAAPAPGATGTALDVNTLLNRRPVPDHLRDAMAFKHRPRQQHPCYTTSSNAYGQKKASQSELPQQWNGVKGEFTKNFTGGAYRDNSFNTGITRSKVHKVLDD